ncbi:MAG: hypothetical protein IJZ90_02970, partial [Clostridia bacterium]|nr:hypothetical protein [Clostridia bacterium]
ATWTDYGVKAYYKCSCGKYFTDSACTKEITDLSTWKSGNGRIDKASHIGGTASCTEKAKCSVCKEEYGTTADHKYDVKWNTDKTNHWHKCTVCEKESDISAHTDSDKNGKCDICLYLTNKYPSIIIDKKDAIVKIEGIVTTKEVQSNTLLEGAVFGLYAKEDIYNEEGKLIATEGTLIEREVTGADGMASFFSSLPHGKYYVREMEAPAGYIKADKCIEIEASKESSDTNTIRFEGEFENYPIKLEIYGSTSENRKQITTIFSIIDSDAHVIESWTHNNKTHYVERIPIGKYTLKKEINFYGYSFTSDMAFEVTETKEIQKISIENTLESGVITIKKICENSGKGIIGTEFEIRNKDGDVIETLVTDKNGLAKSDLLPIGISQTDSVTYYIAETKASVGYIHDETVHKVEFRYSGKGSEAIAYTLELTGKSSESDPVQTTDTSNTCGIVIAITFSAIVLAGIIIFLWKKKKKDEQAKNP